MGYGALLDTVVKVQNYERSSVEDIHLGLMVWFPGGVLTSGSKGLSQQLVTLPNLNRFS